MRHPRIGTATRARAALYALGALDPAEAEEFAAHLREGCASCEQELSAFTAVAGDLGLAAPPVAPRPETRARLLANLRGSAAAPANEGSSLVFAMQSEGDWIEVSSGVYRRDLAPDPSSRSASYLVRLEPGAAVSTHQHVRVEHCYMISGTLEVAGRRLQTGDYHRAGAGTTHTLLRSDDGCLLLIVEAAA